MFERFTDKARRVIVLAQDAARDMGHAQIKPAHLLVGLKHGEGMAANAMSQAGVDETALRQRVAALYPTKAANKKIDKVPFSAEAKKCLELSLREALELGHAYIGTEHLLFGVQRQDVASGGAVDALLGVSIGEISSRLTQMLDGAPSARSMRSPAAHAAIESGRSRAGQSPMTTGHLLSGMLADPDSQVSRAFTEMSLTPEQVQAALDAVNLGDTNDASPVPQSITITIGDTTTFISDPDISIALQQLNADQLQDILRKGIDRSDFGQVAG